MKRRLGVMFVLVILLAGVVPVPAAENASVSGDGVRIREKPGTSSAIIGSVDRGPLLEATGRTSLTETINGHEDYWYAVLYQGKTGYMFGQFLARDAGVAVPVEGAGGGQVPTLGAVTIRPEDIVGDWALFDGSPRIIYTFEPEGLAQYLVFQWDADVAGDRVSRKYVTVDLVRGSYTIEGSMVRVAWFWGERPESLFTVQKDKDGVVLIIDGDRIESRFHTAEPGATSIGDIIINTEPDL